MKNVDFIFLTSCFLIPKDNESMQNKITKDGERRETIKKHRERANGSRDGQDPL